MRRPLKPHAATLATVALLAVALAAGAATAGSDEKKESARGDGWLGITMQQMTSSMAAALDMEEGGVLVNSVVEDSPADEAGLEEGDVIVGFDGKDVDDTRDLARLVRRCDPGDEIEIAYVRDGKRRKVKVEVGERERDAWVWSDDGGERFRMKRFDDGDVRGFHVWPDDEDHVILRRWHRGDRDDDRRALMLHGWHADRGYLGVRLDDLTEQLGEYFGVEDGEGALIREVLEDTPAEKAGLKAGDVIVQLDDEKMRDAGDVTGFLAEAEAGDEVAVTVLRKGEDETFTVELAEAEDALAWHGGGDHEMLVPGLKRLQRDLPHLKRLEPRVYRFGDGDDASLEELRQEMHRLQQELQELKKQLDEEGR